MNVSYVVCNIYFSFPIVTYKYERDWVKRCNFMYSQIRCGLLQYTLLQTKCRTRLYRIYFIAIHVLDFRLGNLHTKPCGGGWLLFQCDKIVTFSPWHSAAMLCPCLCNMSLFGIVWVLTAGYKGGLPNSTYFRSNEQKYPGTTSLFHPLTT